MWRILVLLLSCSSSRGLGAQAADTRLDPRREEPLLPGAEELRKPDKGASSAAKAEESQRAGELQLPGRDTPNGGVEGRVLPPTAEPLEDELQQSGNRSSLIFCMQERA